MTEVIILALITFALLITGIMLILATVRLNRIRKRLDLLAEHLNKGGQK